MREMSWKGVAIVLGSFALVGGALYAGVATEGLVAVTGIASGTVGAVLGRASKRAG